MLMLTRFPSPEKKIFNFFSPLDKYTWVSFWNCLFSLGSVFFLLCAVYVKSNHNITLMDYIFVGIDILSGLFAASEIKYATKLGKIAIMIASLWLMLCFWQIFFFEMNLRDYLTGQTWEFVPERVLDVDFLAENDYIYQMAELPLKNYRQVFVQSTIQSKFTNRPILVCPGRDWRGNRIYKQNIYHLITK